MWWGVFVVVVWSCLRAWRFFWRIGLSWSISWAKFILYLVSLPNILLSNAINYSEYRSWARTNRLFSSNSVILMFFKYGLYSKYFYFLSKRHIYKATSPTQKISPFSPSSYAVCSLLFKWGIYSGAKYDKIY